MIIRKKKTYFFQLWKISKDDWKCNNLEDLGVKTLNYLTRSLLLLAELRESRARIGNEIEIRKNSDSHGPLPWISSITNYQVDTGDNYFYGLCVDSMDQKINFIFLFIVSNCPSRWLMEPLNGGLNKWTCNQALSPWNKYFKFQL